MLINPILLIITSFHTMAIEKQENKIDGSSSLMLYLKEKFPKNIGVHKKGFYQKKNRVVRKTFNKFTFTNDLHDIEFRSVKFIDCIFDGIWGFFCVFQNCHFKNCTFRNCRFSHLEEDWNIVYFEKCYFRNVEIDEGSVYNMTYDNCVLTTCCFNGLYPSENIRFYDCEIENTRFTALQYYENGEIERNNEFPDILFQECLVHLSDFHDLNLKNSCFIDTVIIKSSFINCFLDNESIIMTKKLNYESYATMDFQTVLQSDKLNNKILKDYFNINNGTNFKNMISNMTKSIDLPSVFISYSFKDSELAKKIYNRLIQNSIKVFIWEKDAPGGKPLEDIMTSGIGTHDKLLFIASKDSIRSKACQFELTTARKKQEALWENIFFPISIDDYLFKVEKNRIRPIELANEYWENIEEIRRINILDFSAYNNKSYNQHDFDAMIDKIINGLKIEP